jgi:SAM-dependent methyltransferase
MTLASKIKDGVRNAIPRSALLTLKRIAHTGGAHQCVVCGTSVRRFMDQGYGHPVLEHLQVVGGMRKASDECPICRSNDRVRLIHLFTQYHSDLLVSPKRLLHVAPELSLADIWSNVHTLDYVPADLDRQRYRHLRGLQSFDLQAAPFADESFDWIICNHVLEHIPDDQLAMRELFRLLKRGGTALLQVPISLVRGATEEDPGLTDEVERIRRFGQRDHVRLYAGDYYDRLAAAGFAVTLWDACAADPVRAKAWNLNPLEKLTVARRSV